MKSYRDEWLPQLKDSVPVEAFGHAISSYSVALEGWRRGLKLTYVNKYYKSKGKYLIRYILSSPKREHHFGLARGDLVPAEAIKTCMNKDLTYACLAEQGVPIPKGRTFEEGTTSDEIIQFAETLGYPLVIKPTDGKGGVGVIANIKTKEDFIHNLKYVKSLGFSKLIVEEFSHGDDYRIYVIGGKVAGAFKKIPANVTGDGKKSVKQLIIDKNKFRNNIPALYNRPIKVDGETHTLLESYGYNMEGVPYDGERVFLKTKNNISSGGDAIDVTDDLSDDIKKAAVRASAAIPNLVQCGVDMIVDPESGKGVVIEVNSMPGITSHLFPMEGKARDIPKEIIDFYFPETIGNKRANSDLIYYDYSSIYNAFQEGIAKEIAIPKLSTDDIELKRFIVTGEVGNRIYCNKLRKKALVLKLSGYVKVLNKNKIAVILCGSATSVTAMSQQIKSGIHHKNDITSIEEKKRTTPVMKGFKIEGLN
ncbi:ATP-grasp domain-containing protein, partial [Alteribacter aurantiacus]|uniref:ATP-binding protein n=1 Tax=Alteribacter aurantiacus TaxID=254410 RepID=UPI00040B49DD